MSPRSPGKAWITEILSWPPSSFFYIALMTQKTEEQKGHGHVPTLQRNHSRPSLRLLNVSTDNTFEHMQVTVYWACPVQTILWRVIGQHLTRTGTLAWDLPFTSRNLPWPSTPTTKTSHTWGGSLQLCLHHRSTLETTGVPAHSCWTNCGASTQWTIMQLQRRMRTISMNWQEETSGTLCEVK